MKMTNPELKVVRFANDDVIATSMFIVADPDSTSGYSYFNGNMTYYDSDEKGWGVYNADGGFTPLDLEELNDYKAHPNNYYFLGETYDTYTGEFGNLFTKGASYWELYGDQ